MKKIILGAAVAAAAIFGGFTANQTSSEVAMSDLQVENLEALARQVPESGGGYKCPNSIKDWVDPAKQTNHPPSCRCGNCNVGITVRYPEEQTIYSGYTCMCEVVDYLKVIDRC